MDLLLVLTYAAFCVAVFKIFKIPLTKWSVPTAVLGGVILIGTLLMLMNYNHPHSRTAVRAFVTTPILPNVRGLVVDVPVVSNTPLKKGDVLFKIDPKPFSQVVAQKKAALDLAKAQIDQMEEAVAQSKSTVVMAQAKHDRTKQDYERTKAASAAVSERQLDNKFQIYVSAQDGLTLSKASLSSSELELKSQETEVMAQRTAELERAQFDLDACIVRAPSDGYVTHVILRKGMMAVPLPLAPTMVFVPTEDPFVIASFRQNSMQRLKAGYEAEIMFPSIPGRVFKAEVVQTMPALAEGELQASGRLIKASAIGAEAGVAMVPVMVKIDDDLDGYTLPDGIYAEVAVYSDHFHHVAIMRKILFRMKSWQNYIYFDH